MADENSVAEKTDNQADSLQKEFSRLLTMQVISHMKKTGRTDEATGTIEDWSILGFDMPAAIEEARITLLQRGHTSDAIEAEMEHCTTVLRLLVDDFQMEELMRMKRPEQTSDN